MPSDGSLYQDLKQRSNIITHGKAVSPGLSDPNPWIYFEQDSPSPKSSIIPPVFDTVLERHDTGGLKVPPTRTQGLSVLSTQ